METTILKTNLHCNKCVSKIKPALVKEKSIDEFDFNINHPDRLVIIKGNNIDIDHIVAQFENEGYSAEPYNKETNIHFQQLKVDNNSFWKNIKNWKRASFNTLNCLIGCSIGDFGMIIYLQAYYPETSMAWQMILAILAGLTTSIILETVILRTREKFNWSLAFKTAFSMSFISMVGMEIAMNSTDFMITGGKAAFDTATYWLALIPSLIAGFLLPLPYNYYKLEKHGKSYH